MIVLLPEVRHWYPIPILLVWVEAVVFFQRMLCPNLLRKSLVAQPKTIILGAIVLGYVSGPRTLTLNKNCRGYFWAGFSLDLNQTKSSSRRCRNWLCDFFGGHIFNNVRMYE